MMTTLTPPKLLPFDGSGIPQFLKDQNRWAPWKAVFNEKRGKYDKIPCNPKQAEYGISTAAPERWASYDDALDAFKRGQPMLAGVGYVMTKPHGVVGIDLDNCIVDNLLAPWAKEIVDTMDSYTEISPSGKGLRIFIQGEAADWTNHQVGIEVYGGTAPRFLTLTGKRVMGTPAAVAGGRSDRLAALRKQYGGARKIEVEYADMPEVLPPMLTPDINDLELPYYARDFLETGETRGADRSTELFATAVALYQTGLGDDEVLSVLVHNPHTMEVALDHRRQDSDRATLYLWKEHCAKAKGRSASNVASPEDFEMIAEVAQAEPRTEGDAGIPASVSEKTEVAKAARFALQPAGQFAMGEPPSWIIKNVLPRAELVVMYGESGSGKSFMAIDIACAIARGLPWRGHKVAQGRVVYICAEGGGDFRKRLRAYAVANGISLDALNEVLYVINAAPNLIEKADALEVTKSIAQVSPVALVVVDTWAQVLPGANENSGEDIGRALAHCKGLHRATKAAVLLVHHSGKDSSKGARGWSGLRAAADAEFEVIKTDTGRNLKCTKQKGGEDSGLWGFKLHSVLLGEDEDGDPITSCVAVECEVVIPRKGPPKYAKGWSRCVMEALDTLALAGSPIEFSEVVKVAIANPPEGVDTDSTAKVRQASKKLREILLDDDTKYTSTDGKAITFEE